MTVDEVTKLLVLQSVRNRIIEHLELLSSFDDQREYQKTVPNVYLPYELINAWEDWVTESSTTSFIAPVFTEAESMAIEKFHSTWDLVAEALPDNYPHFEKVLSSDYWAVLRQGAEDALQVLSVRGKLSEQSVE